MLVPPVPGIWKCRGAKELRTPRNQGPIATQSQEGSPRGTDLFHLPWPAAGSIQKLIKTIQVAG
jgi:hypothetical protein